MAFAREFSWRRFVRAKGGMFADLLSLVLEVLMENASFFLAVCSLFAARFDVELLKTT